MPRRCPLAVMRCCCRAAPGGSRLFLHSHGLLAPASAGVAPDPAGREWVVLQGLRRITPKVARVTQSILGIRFSGRDFSPQCTRTPPAAGRGGSPGLLVCDGG